MALWAGRFSRDERLVRALLALALTAALGSMLVLGPDGLPMPSCVFRDLTGLSCLTCGLTRSLEAASHGHLREALQFHLLGPLVLAGMMMLVLVWAVEASAGKQLVWFRNARRHRYAILVVLVIWIAYGVARVIV